MVGYVTSADSTNNWINIEITVLYADDFIFESYGCEREVYHYNRVAGKIYRVFPERDEIINATYQTLIDAVDLIKCIEAYEECPIKNAVDKKDGHLCRRYQLRTDEWSAYASYDSFWTQHGLYKCDGFVF